MYRFLPLLILLIFQSCSVRNKEYNDIEIIRLENLLLTSDSSKIDDNSRHILDITFPNVKVNNSNYESWSEVIVKTPIYILCKPKVDSIFSNNNYLQTQIRSLSDNYSSIFTDSFPSIYTTITPYNQSIMLGDGYVAIGLNHYLGSAEAMYDYFPEYKRKYKNPDRIKIDLSEALVKNGFNDNNIEDPTNNNVLSAMITEGLVIKLMQKLNSDLSVDKILMWSDSDKNTVRSQESNFWQFLISNDILYSTDSKYIQELIEPSPTHFYSGITSLDMIGRYLGYKIVDKYLSSQNIDISIESVKSIINQLPQDVLLKSGYNGK